MRDQKTVKNQGTPPVGVRVEADFLGLGGSVITRDMERQPDGTYTLYEIRTTQATKVGEDILTSGGGIIHGMPKNYPDTLQYNHCSWSEI